VSGLVTDKRIKQVSRLDSYLISEVDHHYLFAPNIFQKTKSLGDQRCLRKIPLTPGVIIEPLIRASETTCAPNVFHTIPCILRFPLQVIGELIYRLSEHHSPIKRKTE